MQLYISTCAAMSTLAIWCRVVHSRVVSPYIFDGPAMSGLAFSVPPQQPVISVQQYPNGISITFICQYAKRS